MKRIGNLYNQVVNLDNLYKAELKARKGKANKPYVKEYVNRLDENIQELYLELKTKTYKTSEYSHFVIYEPKARNINKLPYKDRIVHHSLMNILEPIFVKCFISQTYSCIKGRGILKCLHTLTKYLKVRENRFCLKLDIKKFYESINNDILLKMLRAKFKDKELILLLENIILSIKGLPLGSYTSQ